MQCGFLNLTFDLEKKMNTINVIETQKTTSQHAFNLANAFSQQFGEQSFYTIFNYLKAKASNKKLGLSAAEHVLYNIVRGHPINRGFTPVSNQVKLSNGMHPELGLIEARASLKYKLKFSSLPADLKMSKEMLDFFLKALS
jgi:hypothetical protein